MLEAASRYGLDDARPGSSDPAEMLRWAIRRSKAVLSRDRYHVPVLFFLMPDGAWEPGPLLAPEDQLEKHALMRVVANLVESNGASGLLFVGEVWMRTMSEFEDRQKPTREGLKVTLALSTGHVQSFVTPFTRDSDGRIVFEETRESPSVKEFWLEPLFEVWSRKKKARVDTSTA